MIANTSHPDWVLIVQKESESYVRRSNIGGITNDDCDPGWIKVIMSDGTWYETEAELLDALIEVATPE